MKLLQTYDTTILSDSSEHAFQAIVVPARSLPLSGDIQPLTVLEALELKKLKDATPTDLARDMAQLLAVGVPDTDFMKWFVSPTSNDKPSALDTKFAELVCFDAVIPFEQSPLSAESLIKLVTHASGAAIGAYVGFVISGGTPLLLVTVPAGMIICGAAKGVATALEQGLKQKIVNWLKPKKEKATMATLHYKNKKRPEGEPSESA